MSAEYVSKNELPSDAQRGGWQIRAYCRPNNPECTVSPETFFPLPTDKVGIRLAKEACAKCVVKPECLDAALENNERFGVWGGLSERERQNLKRKRK